MEMSCNLPAFGHCVKKLFCAILGVRGHKADYKISGQSVDHFKKLCKIDVTLKVFTVGVYVLTQQGNILTAVCDKLFGLFDNFFRLTASFTASYIGHNAV